VNHIVGLDLTTAAVEHLKQQFPEGTFYKADIGETGVLASSPLFDVISGFDVLFHIVDDSRYRRAIANIHSLLQPGGIFLFSDVFVHNQVLPDRHFVCRSLHQTEQVLNENGFEILDRKPVFVLMGKPVDSRHRLRKLMWGGFQKVVSKSELAGFVAGAILYPVEVTLASMLRESISTELMICRKRKPAQDLSAIMLKRRQLVALCRKSD
jgi:SAM-dependent methyltransferase